MDDEQLIELVREANVLYDMSNKKYMDPNHKNLVWEQIGTVLNTDGATCKTRWVNIRDNYRRSKKKTLTKSGQGSTSTKKYKYTDQLSFLDKINEDRNTISNISYTDVPQESTEVYELLEMENIPTITLEDVDIQEDEALPPVIRKNKRKREVAETTISSTDILQYLMKKNNDPVGMFLTGISPSLRKLKPRQWLLARQEIFSIVKKYELQHIMQEEDESSN